MTIDVQAAENFIWSTARLVDRHRYSFLFKGGRAEPVIDALRGYRNPDGGFGHGLEPDLRSPESQPAPTLYALEILNEVGASEHEMTRGARDWIASIADRDGSVPMALPGLDDYPHAPWYETAPASILTLGLAATQYAAHATDDAWLTPATDWCWRSIEQPEEQPSGYWLKYALAFLDAVPDEDRAHAALHSLRGTAETVVPVAGAEGEALRPLDLSPKPESRSRELISQAAIEDHLDLVESEQLEDGGWMFDWLAWSPAQACDWRGNVTLRALTWLRDNGRI